MSSVGDALELARTLRREGFVATHIEVGDVKIELAPVMTQPTASRGKADAQGVLDEYGGAAIAKILGETTDDGGDDEYVTAVTS